jgi:hypothetical protein
MNKHDFGETHQLALSMDNWASVIFLIFGLGSVFLFLAGTTEGYIYYIASGLCFVQGRLCFLVLRAVGRLLRNSSNELIDLNREVSHGKM